MIKEVRDQLEKPFDKKYIKQRKGAFGKILDYIEGDKVIQRLNDIFGSNWSFRVLNNNPSECLINGHIVVPVSLQVKDIVGKNQDGSFIYGEWIIKEQVGGKRATLTKQDNSMLDLANDFKASITDGLKKCATELGVALDLYGSDDKVIEEDTDKKVESTTESKQLGPATSIQLSAINKIAEVKKISNVLTYVSQQIKKPLTKLEELKEDEAKVVISALNSYKN